MYLIMKHASSNLVLYVSTSTTNLQIVADQQLKYASELSISNRVM